MRLAAGVERYTSNKSGGRAELIGFASADFADSGQTSPEVR
jgi:hypothetical protein